MLSSSLPALSIFATARVGTHINKCRIHRRGVTAGECGTAILQIIDNLLCSLFLRNAVGIFKSVHGQVTHDNWTLYHTLKSFCDKAIEGMMNRQSFFATLEEDAQWI